MLIADLLAGLQHRWTRGRDDREVDSIAYDSRKTAPGGVFVAMPGVRTDGLRCAPEAIGRGAAAVVVGTGRSGSPELSGAPRVIEVEDERVALAVMARNLHGRVDATLTMVGVTGTNGKTTTCSLVAAILERAGTKTGVLGTVGHRVGEAALLVEGQIGAGLTTPEAPEIHEYLARMKSAGCGACVMEVSSIALDRKRVYGIRFAVGVFTNLTRDHLDYHKDMETYFRAKRLLFEELDARAQAVVNVDDPYGRRLVSECDGPGRPRVTTYGTAEDAGIRLMSVDMTSGGSKLHLEERTGGDGRTRVTVETPLIGRFNAFNIAAAAAAVRSLDVPWNSVIEGVASVASVPGRLERVVLPGRRQEFDVFVDYAHTDDALRVALETVRQVTRGKVIVVFGCGGDRDRSKRPLMGAAAQRLADLVFVTSDNPRSEEPGAIIEEVLAGMKNGDRVRSDPDRRRAIGAAIEAAGPGDAVVIAGKGHETYQIIGDRVTHFDDRDVARETLARVLS